MVGGRTHLRALAEMSLPARAEVGMVTGIFWLFGLLSYCRVSCVLLGKVNAHLCFGWSARAGRRVVATQEGLRRGSVVGPAAPVRLRYVEPVTGLPDEI